MHPQQAGSSRRLLVPSCATELPATTSHTRRRVVEFQVAARLVLLAALCSAASAFSPAYFSRPTPTHTPSALQPATVCTRALRIQLRQHRGVVPLPIPLPFHPLKFSFGDVRGARLVAVQGGRESEGGDSDDDDIYYGDLSLLSGAASSAGLLDGQEQMQASGSEEEEGDEGFSGLGLDSRLVRAAVMQGWRTPTDIQTRVIPAVLDGADVWAEAPTGSGKTGAFGLPLLQLLLEPSLAPPPRRRHAFASALVLSPTRELAVQTGRVLQTLAARVQEPRLRVAVAYGGVPIEGQLYEVERGGVDVLVATPGRLLDLCKHNPHALGDTRVVIFDEADRLLAPAFASELEMLLQLLPGLASAMLHTDHTAHTDPDGSTDRAEGQGQTREPRATGAQRSQSRAAHHKDSARGSRSTGAAGRAGRGRGGAGEEGAEVQVLLLSATFPYKTRAAARRLLHGRAALTLAAPGTALAQARHAEEQSRAQGATPPSSGAKASKYFGGTVAENVRQRAILVDARSRTAALVALAQSEGWSRVLVFVESQHRAEHVTRKLLKRGLTAAALHGGLTQDERQGRLLEFESERVQMLIATDVAARGLDVRGLAAVVNYDLPRSTADYTHRVGRTGRAGQHGVALSLLSWETEPHFALIEARHAQTPLPRETLPGLEPRYPPPASAAQTEATAPERSSTGGGAGVGGGAHSTMGLAHDKMHGGVKGRRKSKKDKLREAQALRAASLARAAAAAAPPPPPADADTEAAKTQPEQTGGT